MESPEKGDPAALPLLTPKNAGGSQRVIKQIMVIDPNKLRLAGLDVKMAEALKKSKPKSPPKSKESKLTIAKNILNKKLKEALAKKDSKKGQSSSPQTTANSLNYIEEAAKKLSSSQLNKAVRVKPKISVATLKSLMPPPSFPVSSLISPNQTVEIKVLKSENTKQSIEVKIVDSSRETSHKLDKFPKASLKTPRTKITHKTEAITSEINFEVRKKLSLLEDPEPTVVEADCGQTSQTVIVHVDEKKTPTSRKEFLKEIETVSQVHSKSLTKDIEAVKNKTPKIVHFEPQPEEVESLNKNTTQEESLITEATTSIDITPATPIHVESLSQPSELSPLKTVTTSTPIRRESFPKVIESKVLSPDEKIDLSLLTKRTPVALTVPKKRYKLDQNWITPEPNRGEPIYLNLSPVAAVEKPSPVPEPKSAVAAEESAVDFINNLSMFFAESQKTKSKAKDLPESLTKECSEDATSFLVSLFQTSQRNSPEIQKATTEKDEESNAFESTCTTTNDVQSSGENSILEIPSNTTNTQISEVEIKNLPNQDNKTKKDQEFVKALDESLDYSHASISPNCKKTSIEDKSIISNSENDNNISIEDNTSSNAKEDVPIVPKEPIESIEPPSDFVKTITDSSLPLPSKIKVDKEIPNVSLNTTPHSLDSEIAEESTPKSSMPAISSRRKANKPIPVLVPKLRKSRKPPTAVQNPPEELKKYSVPQKSTQQPVEESPTQPVQNKEEVNIPVSTEESAYSHQTKEDNHQETKNLADTNAQATSQKFTRKRERRDTPKSGIFEPSPSPTNTLPSMPLEDTAEMPEELPTTSSKTGRPQRQRKISLKLAESSEFLPTITSAFQGIVDITVEKSIKEKKEPPTTTERSQRQRKVSFKLLESTELHPTDIKPSNQEQDNLVDKEAIENMGLVATGRPQRQRKMTFKLLDSSSEPMTSVKQTLKPLDTSIKQETKEKIPMPTTSERPQRQKKLTYKLMESSESFSLSIKSQKQSGEKEIKEKIEEPTEKPQCTKDETENKDPDSLIAVEMKNNALNDPIAQLVAFHETVEKFELACGSLKSKRVEDIALNFEGEGNSLSEYPFHDAICRDSLSQKSATNETSCDVPVPVNQPIESGKDNISKVLRKRKDSLKTRNFSGEQMSIVSSDSEKKPTRKRKEASTSIIQSEIEEASELSSSSSKHFFETTPKQSETKLSARQLVTESVQSEVESKEMLNKSAPLDNLDSTTPSISANIETPTNSSAKKRRGRPPKAKNIPKVEVVEMPKTRTTTRAKSSSVQPKINALSESSNIGGSWETLPSSDEHLGQDVNDFDKNVSKKGKKITENSKFNFLTNKLLDDSMGFEHKVEEAPDKTISIEKEIIFDDDKVPNKVETIEQNVTPMVPTKKKGRPPKGRKKSSVNRSQATTGEEAHNVLAKGDVNKQKNSPDDRETSKDTTTLKASSSSDFAEAKKTQTCINKEQSISKDDSSDHVKQSIDAGTSDDKYSELPSVEKKIREDSLVIELGAAKSPIKANDPEIISSQHKEMTLTFTEPTETLEPTYSDIIPTDSLGPSQVEYHHTGVDSFDQENEPKSNTELSTTQEDLFDNLKLPARTMETSHTPSSKSHSTESDLAEKQTIRSDEPNTIKPPKIIPHFEDITFDLDNIESPSFSPLCDRSKISDESDGFEDLDEHLTSALIETVAAAEKSAEDSNMCVEEQEVDNSKQYSSLNKSTSSKIVENEIVKESLSVCLERSSDNSKPTVEQTSDKVAENVSVHSSVTVVTEILNKDKQSSSFSPNPIEKQSPPLSSSRTDEKLSEDVEIIEQSLCDKAIGSSPVLDEKKPAESASLTFSTSSTKSSKKLKSDSKRPSNDQKSLEESSSDKINQSSALFHAVYSKSEEKTKIQKAKRQSHKEKNTDTKSQNEFLGFNAEEIEEGQQSTSLRLSQSEDAETLNIESPSTSKTKAKEYTIKESQVLSGKKTKEEKQKWEQNSAKSLMKWLSNPVKEAAASNDVCHLGEDAIDQSSSFPPKKRRNKVQNLDETINPGKDVQNRDGQINDAYTMQVNLEITNLNRSVSTKNEKAKRGRGKKVSILDDSLREDITSSREDLNSSINTVSNRSKQLKITEEDTSSRDDTPKRGRKSKKDTDDEFKTPKRGRKPKNVADQSIGAVVKAEPTENTPTLTCTPTPAQTSAPPPTPKERGKKRKRSTSEEECTSTTAEPPTKVAHLDEDILSSCLFVTKRKPGRPPKPSIFGPSKVAESAAAASPNVNPITKKYKDDCEFNPRLLLIRNKEELKSTEPLIDPTLQTEPKGPNDVQCALCMGYTPKKTWIKHVSQHYGVGWIVGQPPPLNIKSRQSVLSFLIEFYKVSKLKGLNCRLCNSLRRSGLGLLMHLEQCCLTKEELSNTRIVCEYCKKNYSKSSYAIHKKDCPEYLKKVLEESKAVEMSVQPDGPQDDVLSNTGRLKRKSVIKAETKLKTLSETPEFIPEELIKYIPSQNIPSMEMIKENWNMEINTLGKAFCASKKCNFTATDVDDLIVHYQEKVCKYFEKPGYFCSKCKFHNDTIEAVRSHVIARHSPKPPKRDSDVEINSSESSDSISSGDEEVETEAGSGGEDENGEKKPKQKKKNKKKKKLPRFFAVKNSPTKEYKKLLPERCTTINGVVVKHYEKFIRNNYSVDPLFTFAKTNVIYVDASEAYFPKSTESMKFLHDGFHGFVKVLGESKVKPDQWKQLERLHGITEKSEYIIYMGGPVKDLAWAPLDPHPPSNTQYLAVTVRKGIDKFTRYVNQKRSRSLIYILQIDISTPSAIKGEISYAIAIDEGPIHAIEFLPSGGYAPEMNRLGLLAVGCAETDIKIYSLPLKVEKSDCDLFPIVRLEATIELHLKVLENPSDATDSYESQCTTLVWSQSAGHNIIVAGFLNGFVGIWDISDDADNLNRFDLNNETRRFVPVSYFWTSEDRLMQLALHYDMNGPRWLAASNSTRKLMLYDLRDITEPILFRIEVTINIISCIAWPIVWENILFGLGDTMPSNGCVITAFSPMAIMYSCRRFEKFCTGVTDIHYNIWKNCFAAGSDNGDIQITPLREGSLDVSQRLKLDVKTIYTLDLVPLKEGDKIGQCDIKIPTDGMRVFDKDHKDQYGIVFGSIRKLPGRQKPEYYKSERVPPLNLQRLVRLNKIRYNLNKNACDVLAMGYNNGILRVDIKNWLTEGQK